MPIQIPATTPKFHRFPDLPPELRFKIWAFAGIHRQNLLLRGSFEVLLISSKIPLPPKFLQHIHKSSIRRCTLLDTTHESRQEHQKSGCFRLISSNPSNHIMKFTMGFFHPGSQAIFQAPMDMMTWPASVWLPLPYEVPRLIVRRNFEHVRGFVDVEDIRLYQTKEDRDSRLVGLSRRFASLFAKHKRAEEAKRTLERKRMSRDLMREVLAMVGEEMTLEKKKQR